MLTVEANEVLSNLPPNMPTRNSPVSVKFGRAILQLIGWKLVGEIPNEQRMVVCAAPHTSNWDFFVGLPVILAMDVKASIMMKKEAFIWPLSGLWAWIGFIPVDRKAPRGVVGSIVSEFSEREQLWLAIAPEGTRAKAKKWKTGFLSIAEGANVPIMLLSWDYPSKTIQFGPMMTTSGNRQQDLLDIQAHFRQFEGRRPENTNYFFAASSAV